jgi:hypothetical protein
MVSERDSVQFCSLFTFSGKIVIEFSFYPERKRTTENFTLLSLYKVHARDIEVDESETSYYENSDDQGNILSEEQDKTTLRVCVKLFQNQIFDVVSIISSEIRISLFPIRSR